MWCWCGGGGVVMVCWCVGVVVWLCVGVVVVWSGFFNDFNTTPSKVVFSCFGLLVGLWQNASKCICMTPIKV